MKLFGAVLMFVAACSGSASSPNAPSAPSVSSGRAERLRIGSLEAYALEDGHLVVPNDGQLLGVGRPPSETAELLAAAGLPRDSIRLDIQCLLVKVGNSQSSGEGERVILFDTGLNDASYPKAGHLLQSLALAGAEPAAIADIFISHAHSDHVGGLVTKSNALAFPAATIHMSAAEWATLQADTDENGKRLVAAITLKVVTFGPGAQVLPMVKAVATPGHTAGHSSYEIGTGADKIFYLGDVAHHSVISVQRPAWSIQVDADHPVAEATRQSALAKLAADHTQVFAPHFPFPGVGHVVAKGQGLVWKPETR